MTEKTNDDGTWILRDNVMITGSAGHYFYGCLRYVTPKSTMTMLATHARRQVEFEKRLHGVIVSRRSRLGSWQKLSPPKLVLATKGRLVTDQLPPE